MPTFGYALANKLSMYLYICMYVDDKVLRRLTCRYVCLYNKNTYIKKYYSIKVVALFTYIYICICTYKCEFLLILRVDYEYLFRPVFEVFFLLATFYLVSHSFTIQYGFPIMYICTFEGLQVCTVAVLFLFCIHINLAHFSHSIDF